MPEDTRPYIVVTNELFRHPKFRALSRSARLRIIELWAHCNEYMTDGEIDAGTWAEIPAKERKELETAGWVERDTAGRRCHDYLKHQKSRQQILELKADRAEAGAFGAHSRHHLKRGRFDPSCKWCTEALEG